MDNPKCMVHQGRPLRLLRQQNTLRKKSHTAVKCTWAQTATLRNASGGDTPLLCFLSLESPMPMLTWLCCAHHYSMLKLYVGRAGSVVKSTLSSSRAPRLKSHFPRIRSQQCRIPVPEDLMPYSSLCGQDSWKWHTCMHGVKNSHRK